VSVGVLRCLLGSLTAAALAMLKRFAMFLLASVWLLHAAGALAQFAGPLPAEQVKAAFLYNFARFVTWPPESATQRAIVIGVMADDYVEAELRRNVEARSAQGRQVSVRTVASIGDTQGVHVLFIGSRLNDRLHGLIAALKRQPILVVTEAEDALDHGSMINFVTTERVQFEISIAAASRAGLQLSSRLLSVAMRIRKGEVLGTVPTLHAILPDCRPSIRQPCTNRA
jgi:hypothetical protein